MRGSGLQPGILIPLVVSWMYRVERVTLAAFDPLLALRCTLQIPAGRVCGAIAGLCGASDSAHQVTKPPHDCVMTAHT